MNANLQIGFRRWQSRLLSHFFMSTDTPTTTRKETIAVGATFADAPDFDIWDYIPGIWAIHKPSITPLSSVKIDGRVYRRFELKFTTESEKYARDKKRVIAFIQKYGIPKEVTSNPT